jgi:hypothetical protein
VRLYLLLEKKKKKKTEKKETTTTRQAQRNLNHSIVGSIRYNAAV